MLHVGRAVAITVHALLNKRDARKAVGWIALAWLAPIGGALASLVFGVSRSLPLNFEYNLECDDTRRVQQLDTLVEKRITRAQRLTTADLTQQPVLAQRRERLVWLLAPYL